MIALLAVEVRRLVARRLVRLAGLLAALGIAVAGIAVAANADEFFTPGDLPGILAGTTVPLVLAAWVIGASSIGAEWHSGAMATTLTWEPRRFRLIAAKLLAVVGLAFVFTVTFQALLTLALLPSTNDATAGFHYVVSPAGGPGLEAEGWLSVAVERVVRGAVLAGVGAAFGFSVASIGRNTAAGVGIGFAYLVILENLIAQLVSGVDRWLLIPNAVIFVGGEDVSILVGRSAFEAGLVLAIYAVAASALATALFRARDVT